MTQGIQQESLTLCLDAKSLSLSNTGAIEPIQSLSFLPTGTHKGAHFSDHDLDQIKLNFSKHAKDGFLPSINYDHKAGAAAGWVEDIEKTGTALTAKVAFNDDGIESITKKRYRYLSADLVSPLAIKPNWTLVAIALTNDPAVKGQGMSVFFHTHQHPHGDNTMSDIEQKLALSAQDVISGLTGLAETEILDVISSAIGMIKDPENLSKLKDIVDPQAPEEAAPLTEQAVVKNSADEDEGFKNLALSSRIEELEAKLKLAATETEFTSLLQAGKVVEAQRAAYLSDNCYEFAKNSQQLNLSAQGSSAPIISDVDQAYAKLSEQAEKIRTELKLSASESMSKARYENQDLVRIIEA